MDTEMGKVGPDLPRRPYSPAGTAVSKVLGRGCVEPGGHITRQPGSG